VVLATREPSIDDPRIAFRTVVPMRPERITATGARFAILHRDRPRLARIIRALRVGRRPDHVPATSRPTPARHRLVRAARLAEPELRGAWGPPQLTDRSVLVWDLDQVGAQSP
jgi:hypothetical protein